MCILCEVMLTEDQAVCILWEFMFTEGQIVCILCEVMLTEDQVVCILWEVMFTEDQVVVASVLYCSINHCTSFEKNEIEEFRILILMTYLSFLMTYLSKTLESYKRVKICPYSANNLHFYEYLAIKWNLWTFFQFSHRTVCPKNRHLRSMLWCSIFIYSS